MVFVNVNTDDKVCFLNIGLCVHAHTSQSFFCGRFGRLYSIFAFFEIFVDGKQSRSERYELKADALEWRLLLRMWKQNVRQRSLV